MKFHVHFNYGAEKRESLLRMLRTGELNFDSINLNGAWIAVQTGSAFAIIEAKDAPSVFHACQKWADLGQITLTPVIAATEV